MIDDATIVNKFSSEMEGNEAIPPEEVKVA
jgi:hypothetical protein